MGGLLRDPFTARERAGRRFTRGRAAQRITRWRSVAVSGRPTSSSRFLPSLAVACRCALVVLVCVLAEACAGRVHPSGPAKTAGSSFVATAYCTGQRTASGTRPTRDTVAADLAVLPMGTRIRVSGLADRYNGLYVVRDTGSQIRGHRIDLYIHDCDEAVRFGRRSARVSVVR
jgi:3D (Asp-Asp-Asp) domain-containing protein